MGAARGGISRHRPDRHPAARADRPGSGPAPATPGSTCPAGRVTWPRPGAPSGSACSSPTAARPPGAPAADGRTTIPSQQRRSCTRSPAAADRTLSSPGGGRGRCRPPGRWSSSASGRRSALPNPGSASMRSLSSTRPGAASGYGRKTKADGGGSLPLAAADRNRAIEARPGSRRVPGAADRERPVQRQAVRGPAGLRRNKLTHKHTDGLCRACRVASVRSSRRRSAVACGSAASSAAYRPAVFRPSPGGLPSLVPSGALRSPNSRSYGVRSTLWPGSKPRAPAPGPHQRPGGSPPLSLAKECRPPENGGRLAATGGRAQSGSTSGFSPGRLRPCGTGAPLVV